MGFAGADLGFGLNTMKADFDAARDHSKSETFQVMVVTEGQE